MTIATVIDIPIMYGLIENTKNAIHRHSGYAIFRVGQGFFPIFGALLGAIAMTSVFIFERSILVI
jgi:hypothetical protein